MTIFQRKTQALRFAIEVEGVVDPRWSEWFSGLDVAFVPCAADAANTLLIASLPDQAALPALLARVTGLNLKVVSVTPGTKTDSK